MKIIIRVLVNAIALWLTALILPAFNLTGDILGILVVAIIFGLVNAFIRPIVKLFTLPINLLTLGLFTLVINALLIMLAASIVPGFAVQGFWWALLFGIVLAIVNFALSPLLK